MNLKKKSKTKQNTHTHNEEMSVLHNDVFILLYLPESQTISPKKQYLGATPLYKFTHRSKVPCCRKHSCTWKNYHSRAAFGSLGNVFRWVVNSERWDYFLFSDSLYLCILLIFLSAVSVTTCIKDWCRSSVTKASSVHCERGFLQEELDSSFCSAVET